jgi:hypothetical protein
VRVATSAALVFCVAEPPVEGDEFEFDELELLELLEELDDVLVVVVDVVDVGEFTGDGAFDCATAEVATIAV